VYGSRAYCSIAEAGRLVKNSSGLTARSGRKGAMLIMYIS
jgi:hypothetical protein